MGWFEFEELDVLVEVSVSALMTGRFVFRSGLRMVDAEGELFVVAGVACPGVSGLLMPGAEVGAWLGVGFEALRCMLFWPFWAKNRSAFRNTACISRAGFACGAGW